MFDEVHVVIGPNPAKPYPWFTEEERKIMIEDSTPWDNVKVNILKEPRLIDYANKLAKEKHNVIVIRGIRDVSDYYVEEAILKCMRDKAYSGVDFMYFYSPECYKQISSTIIKDWVSKDRWDCVETAVHRIVGKSMLERRYRDVKKDINKFPDLYKRYVKANSIFETTTAGFVPSEMGMPCDCFEKNPEPKGFPDDDNCSLQQMASSEEDWWVPKYEPHPDLEKVREYFDKAVEYGLIKLPEVLNSQQVSYMIDDCKYDVISSTEYRLMKIPINSVKPTGKRYQGRSSSIGPIIVDRNFFPDDAWHTKHPALIIEGKHRWLDAVERGEDYIWAWVGEEVLDFFKLKEYPCQEKIDFCRGDGTMNESHKEVSKILEKEIGKGWIVTHPPVADIYNPASANFAPHVLETENGRIDLQVLGSGLADLPPSGVQSVAPEQ